VLALQFLDQLTRRRRDINPVRIFDEFLVQKKPNAFVPWLTGTV